MKEQIKRAKKHKSAGFTLLELLITLVVLGVVTALIAPVVNGNVSRSADARSIVAFSDLAQRNLQSILVATGASNNLDTPTFTQASNTALDVLVGGEDYVAADMVTDYSNSGIGVINRMVGVTVAPVAASSAGEYTVRGYEVELGGTGGEMIVTLTDVPSELVEILANEMDGGSAFDAANADATGVVQYDAETGGLHEVTIHNRIN